MRFVKDTVFKMQFGYKDHCAELYNYVTGTEDATPDSIEYWTIDAEELGTALRNDLCFSVGDQLMLFTEAQSTYPYNMPLRLLFYCAEVYKAWVREHKIVIHKAPNVKIPAPKFCVLCSRDAPSEQVLSLSSMFKQLNGYGEGVELYVQVLIAEQISSDFLAPSVVREYVDFCNLYDSVRKEYAGHDLRNIVRAVKEQCVRQQLLKRVISDYGKEFDGIVSAWMTREEELRYEREEGIELGRQQCAQEMLDLLRQGVSPEEAARRVGLGSKSGVKRMSLGDIDRLH